MNTHRIAFYADIHYKADPVPAYWTPPPNLDVEAILFGGDIHFRPEHLGGMMQAIRATQRAETILIVVPGNGDYIDQDLEESRAHSRAAVAAVDNAVFLDDETLLLPSGLRVIGSTLWSALSDDEIERYSGYLAEHGQNGVDNIRVDGKPLTLEDTNRLHARARSFIEGELRRLTPAERRATVVCTHFWPTLRVVNQNDPNEVKWTKMLGSDMDEVIDQHGPRYWLAGHIHASKDLVIGDTRLIGNPRVGDTVDTVNHDFVDTYVLEFAA